MAENQARSPHSADFERFRACLDRYASLAASAGKTIRRSPPEEARKLFDALSAAKRSEVIKRLETEVSIFEETLAAGQDLANSPHLLWRYLVRHKGTPCADLFDRIGAGDVIEVYGLDQVHTFQNLKFFDFISLTLERVYCEPWWQVSRREPEFAQRIYESAVKIISGEVQTTLDPKVPFHLVEEIDSEMGFKFYLRLKCLSPIFTEQRLTHVVAISECSFTQPA